jgi:hypothetical protein
MKAVQSQAELLLMVEADRACCTAGISRPISTPVTAVTTSSSTSVTARRQGNIETGYVADK